MKTTTRQFEILINGRPMQVKATAFEMNNQTRYRVSCNGGPVHIFGWDVSHEYLMVIDSGSERISSQVETAIARALQGKVAA